MTLKVSAGPQVPEFYQTGARPTVQQTLSKLHSEHKVKSG